MTLISRGSLIFFLNFDSLNLKANRYHDEFILKIYEIGLTIENNYSLLVFGGVACKNLEKVSDIKFSLHIFLWFNIMLMILLILTILVRKSKKVT